MSDYIGAREQEDEFIGSRFVEAAYKGSTKYYDPYSEVSGSLPLAYESRAEHIFKNYALYGTSAGSGEQTENVFNKDAKDTSNGYVAGAYLKEDGSTTSASGYYISEYIPVDANSTYQIPGMFPSAAVLPSLCRYDENKGFISGVTLKGRSSFYSGAAAYIRITYVSSAINNGMIIQSSTAPTTYIPFGYKIPLTDTGEDSQSETYPLYIGSTKLGEEEYLDYESGKVYKRTAQLLNQNAKDTRNGYMSGRYLRSNGGDSSNAVLSVSEYIGIEENTKYTVQIGAAYSLPSICFYDTNKAFISGVAYDGSTTLRVTSPANAVYARMSFRTATTNALNKGHTAISINTKYIVPTDPPVPLPPINAYQGENTLSSTETVGAVTVKGRINEPST